ncbi:plant cysteine oxidase 2-like [Durio zibethinus]|uniref:cysteine dioxygenase n=1 Tax=Durio zibethinus TaxID=66656 RepID=A0A6P5WT23_DURZI|nr:plant cysteine oxidase 2-like [Durio zibethinus]
MMLEGGLVERRKDIMTIRHVNNKVRYVNKAIKKNRSYKKRKDQSVVPSVPEMLQELFVTCRGVFKGSGTVPSPPDVNKLRSILDKMKPEDFGLSRDLEFFKATGAVKGNPRVTNTTIYQCDEFSMCIFFLPATAVIPLHNHPGMTVFSKLLLGKMHIKSYDWVDPVNSEDSMPPNSKLRLARLKANSVFTAPCDTSVLYPTTGGNIHQFTAITPCAVLDVLGPPYSKEDDRDCSYYKDIPYSAFSNGETRVSEEEIEDFGWLEKIEAPKNSRMDSIEYLGPQIIETSY